MITRTKKISLPLHYVLLISVLQACGGTEPVDIYEQLERPPQLAVTPSAATEAPAIADESISRNGLGNRIKMLGKKSAPILKLNLDFDNAWLLVGKALRFQKIAITDHDREQGHYLVNFDTDAYENEAEDRGFLESLTNRLFSENFGLRKYQLSIRQIGKFTIIVAKDIGAIKIDEDAEDDIRNVDGIVDTHAKAPENAALRIMAVLYKTLRNGFVEPEIKPQKGFFD